MRLFIEKDYDSLSRKAAEIIASTVRGKPDSILGLATGSTPLGIYRELVRMRQNEGLDFSRVKTFNLDEYCGLEKSDPHSYHYYMWTNFLAMLTSNPRIYLFPMVIVRTRRLNRKNTIRPLTPMVGLIYCY